MSSQICFSGNQLLPSWRHFSAQKHSAEPWGLYDSVESQRENMTVILTTTCDGVCVSFPEIDISEYQQILAYQVKS